MKKIIYFALALTALVLGSCQHDDEPLWPSTNPTIEQLEGYKVSYFDISYKLLNDEAYENIKFANLKRGFNEFISCPVVINPAGSLLRCGLHIAESVNVADGIYLLTFSDADGNPLRGMVKLQIEDEHVVKAEEAESSFSLRHGSGTQADPYEIGSERDFLTFLDDLRKNELTNGRDVWFRQTADIRLMDQSNDKPGRGYYGYSFAGHYDGGGFTLYDLYYRGASNPTSDVVLGLFPTILDGADISNLAIAGVNMSNVSADAGALAGVSKGNVKVSDVTIQGNISGDNGNGIGGLIGRMAQGNLTLSNIKFKMSVSGKSNVGGILGKMDDGTLNISGITTPEHHFYVEGYESVGGVVGNCVKGKLSISSATLSHVVSKEDSDIRIICTTGGEGTGGIIGKIGNISAQAVFKDITVECPVGGANRVGNKIGGIAGAVDCNQNISISGCRMTSIVSGNHEVGGFFGHLYIKGSAKLIIGGDSQSNYVLPDDCAAAIEAYSSGGGVFGYLQSPKIEADPYSVRVAVNVDVTEQQGGGVVGKINETSLHLNIFKMTSSTMQVTGESAIGGIVGAAFQSTLTGDTPFDYDMKNTKAVVPEADAFAPLFIGVVKGKENVGGILGKGENLTLRALSSKCTVTSLGGNNIGGIAGYVYSTGKENVFEDLTSSSLVVGERNANIGGIFGYFTCDDYAPIQDCINYGEVRDGNYAGGIIGGYNLSLGAYIYSWYKQSQVRWCVNKGTVSGTDCVGGIFGKAYCMTESFDVNCSTQIMQVLKCGNDGTVTASSSGAAESGVGGIIGFGGALIQVQDCANRGNIFSDGALKAAGGVAGSLGLDPTGPNSEYKNVQLYNSCNSGTIDAKGSKTRTGGVLGFMEEGPHSNVRNCLNTGQVLNKHDSDNGGIVGYVDHLTYIYYCVNLGMVEHGNAMIGTHKGGSLFYHDGLYYLEGTGASWPSATKVSAADITDKSKFGKLDFEEIWGMSDSGPDLPCCPFR